MAIQGRDCEYVAAFEGDKPLADVVRGRVDLRNRSLHYEIDDSCLCIVTRTEDTFLKFTGFTARCVLDSVGSEQERLRELTRLTGMIPIEQLGTWFIA